MVLETIDYIVIFVYMAVIVGIGFMFRSRAGKSLEEYFISGRSLPWWIAGTSMVATTFAVDTPLAVAGLTIQNGLAGNWFWWAFAMGGMITVFVYAKLWRRAGVITDVELVEMRYSGNAAGLLRGTRAIYIALIVNSIIIGWVTGAMVTIFEQTVMFDPESTGEPHSQTWVMIFALLGMVGLYGMLSGMWGVAIADAIQFCCAMIGCIVLAYVAIQHFGGVEGLESKVIENFGEGGETAFRLIPDFSAENPWMPVHVFLIMLLVQWWATWYPGAEPGGGGYVVQRMAACKDERHSVLATLWYQLAHYCVRPWPWLIVAFAALAMFPALREGEIADSSGFDSGVGFPMVMRTLAPQMPSGLPGLLMVTFFAAFMSTISTQMNWGASYLTRDVYQRFLKPDATDKELATASKIASLVVLACGAVAAYLMNGISVDEAWKILAALGAGTGAVFMMRWFWWRINAWSEISAMVASLVFFLTIESIANRLFGVEAMGNEVKLLVVAVLTIVVWVFVTFVTRPESDQTLDAFYRMVRPGGKLWGPVAERNAEVKVDKDILLSVFTALCATGIVWATIPTVGNIIFKNYTDAIISGAIAIVFGILVAFGLNRLLPKVQVETSESVSPGD